MSFFKYFLYLVLLTCGFHIYGDVINVPAGGDIQAAINAVSAGGTVNLAAGNYPLTAQLYINKDLTLNGAGVDVSVIQSPDTANLTLTFSYTGASAADYTPVIIVENASNVLLQNFTVDGRNQSVVGETIHFTGVGYHNASGTISSLHVLNIMESIEPRGYQEGTAILNANDTGVNTITIQDCLVNFFQKVGIQVIGTGLTFNVSQNSVIGENVEANPNGIEAYDGSMGVISNNSVINLNNPSLQQCSGILIFDSPSLIIENNLVNNNDSGIYVYDCDNTTINSNTVTNNLFGITVDDTAATVAHTFYLNDNTISINTSLSSAITYGLSLYSPTTALINPQVHLDSNTFDSATYGLLVTGNNTDTAGPVVTMHNDTFFEGFFQTTYYILMASCPNDIWPTTYTVSFNGLVSGVMTIAQFDALVLNPLTQQIYDKNTDATLGLVLAYVTPAPPTVTGLNPNSGPVLGGTPVTITGTNFVRGSLVYFGGVLATQIDVISATTIIATSPPGVGTVAVTVTTPNGTSPSDPAGQFTYIAEISSPLPPTDFEGCIKNFYACPKKYQLTAKWKASPSPDVVAYHIYSQGVLVKVIPASSPYVYSACLKSIKNLNYQITAVNSSGVESDPETLKVRCSRW